MTVIKDSITAFGVIAVTLIPIKVCSAPVENNSYSKQLKCSSTGEQRLLQTPSFYGGVTETSKNLDNKSNYEGLNYTKSYFSKHINFQTKKSGIIATFSPKNNLGEKIELQELASVLGYERFAWVNYVEQDPYGVRDRNGKIVQTPYNDPPPGGYEYDGADNHPFYWDIDECDNCKSRHHYQHPKIISKFQLVFEDHPSDPRLRSGESVDFVTHLVGIKKSYSSKKQAEWEILSTFSWQLKNTTKQEGRVSLVKNNIDPTQLSPSLQAQIQVDGGTVNNSAIGHKYNPHNHQCRLQNHHNRDRDS